MKRILVTGANGQLGMTLQDLAPAYQEFNFYFTDKSVLDITRPEEVDKTFQEIKPEYCINCAAYTLVDQAEKTPEPAYAVNAQGVKHLVNACLEHNTNLIHISTDYVFEGQRRRVFLLGHTLSDKCLRPDQIGRRADNSKAFGAVSYHPHFLVVFQKTRT